MNIKGYNESKKKIEEFFAKFDLYEPEYLTKILNNFCNFVGLTISDFEMCFFAKEMEKDDEDYFGDKGVGFFFYEPVFEEDSSVILSYDEFYNEVENAYKRQMEKHHEITGEVTELLGKLKAKIEAENNNENTEEQKSSLSI